MVARTLAVVLGIAVSASAGISAFAISTTTQRFADRAVELEGAPPVVQAPFLGAFEGGFTLLVVGTDNDADQGDDYGERDGVRNDVTILLRVAADHHSAAVVSFPRDLVIPHPECDDPVTGEQYEAMSAQPLNTAYDRGGLSCVATTITALTGVPIQYAAATSFNGVIALTDAVGGVEVCLVDPITDSDSGLDLPAGRSIVAGQTALAFLRARHGVGDGSDLTRIGSQQQYLASLLRKIRSDSTLSDPLKVYALARAAASSITPSTSLESIDSMVSLALTLKDVELAKVVFVQYPTEAWVEDRNKVQPAAALADELFAHLLADQPFTIDETEETTAGPTESDAGDGPVTPGSPPAETSAEPSSPDDAITGLKGQTASEQTCASAFDG